MKKQFQSKSVPRGTRTIWRYLGALFLLFTFAIGNVWAAETVLFSSFANTTTSNYFKDYTVDGKTVSVAASSNISSSSGDYYCGAMGSTPSNNNANYVELTVSGATIKTVSVLITGNGSNKTCQPALLGWEGAIASNTTADYVLVPASQVISNKGLSNAQWHQFDVHGNDLTKVRVYRAVKGVSVADAAAQTYGNGQTLQFYGIRVELEGITSVCPETLTISSKDSKTAFTEGDAIELTAALAKGNGDISYQWYKGGTAEGNKLTGKNTNKLQIASCTTSDAGDYFCVASKTSCDNVTSSKFAITVEADTKCFNMPAITSKPSNLPSVTVTGGSLSDVSVNDKTVSMDNNGLKMGGNDSRLKVTLTGASIIAGTKITVAYKGASTDGSGIGVFDGNCANRTLNATGLTNNGSVSHTFTAEEAANYADEFIINRNGTGKSICINAITVEDCGPAVTKHTVTLNYNDGETPNGSLTVVDGNAAVKPTDPTRGKYTFLGWFVGDTDTEYVWSTAVTDDITLKAHWQDPWTLTFDADGGSAVANVTVKHNTKAEKPTNPTKDDNDFLGWFYGDPAVEFDWDANVTQNYALVAHWQPAVAKYDVEYYDGDTKIGTEPQVWATGHPTAAGIETAKPLYTFVGWYLTSALEGDPVALNTVTPVEGLKFYGKWNKAYAANIDFEAFIDANTTDGDWSAELADKHYAISSTTGVTLDAPNGKPADKGLKIKNSGSYLSFNVHAGKLVLLKAGVLSGAEVSVDGGAHYATLTGATGSTAASVVTPLYNAAEAEYRIRTTTGSYNIIQSITIQDPYQVTFDANGGEDVASLNGTPTVTLPLPVKGSESFLGWFDGETKIGEAGDTYTPTANITLKAHWEAISTDARLASITFSSDAGTLSPAFDSEVTSYTYTMPYGTAAIPTITGATSVSDKAQTPIIGDAATAWGSAQTVKGVAQSGAEKIYTVTMLRAPKDGVEIIGVVTTGGTNKTVSGLYKGDAAVNLDGDKKIGSGKYIYVTLASGYTFEETDVLVVDVKAKSDLPSSPALEITTGVGNIDGSVWKSIANADYELNLVSIPLTGIAANQTSIGLKRSDHQNTWVNGLKVYRPMMPEMTAITINGEDAVKGTGNTYTITLPEEGTDLAALTVVPTIIRNAPHATTPEAVISNEGAWKAGDNTYRVMDKDGDYTDYTITITLQGEAPAPVISTQPAGVAYCAGSEPTLEVVATGDELHYAWFKEAGETDEAVGEDAASYTVEAAGTYYVIVTNHIDGKLDKSVTSENAVVTLNVAAAITKQPTNKRDIVLNNEVTLSVEATNATGYQWYICDDAEKHNAAAISGAEAANYVFNCSANAYYYCVVGNACGADIESNVVSVKLEPVGCNVLDGTIPSAAPYIYDNGEWTLYAVTSGGKLDGSSRFDDDAKDFDGNTVNAITYGRVGMTFAKDVESLTIYATSSSSDRAISSIKVTTDDVTTGTPSYSDVTFTASAEKLGKKDSSSPYRFVLEADNMLLEAGKNYWLQFSGTVSAFKICYSEALAMPVLPTLANQELCAGAAYEEFDATITNAAACEGTVSYKWYETTDTENPVAETATFTPSAEGTYYVVVTHSAAGHITRTVQSDELSVAHFDALSLVSYSDDVFQHMGTEATLSVVATGKNVAYLWYTCSNAAGDDAVAITPAETESSLTIASVAEGVQYYKVVISHDCDATTLSHVFTVEGWNQLDQVDVTATTTWDMTNVSANHIELTGDDKNARLLLANIDGVNNTTFNAQALKFEGQHIGRTEGNVKHLAGRYVQFNVTVPGAVFVTFASNGNNARTIRINDKKCTRATAGTAAEKYITYALAVEPGSVEIMGMQGDEENQYVRISKIEFKAEYNYHRENLNPNNIGTLCWTNDAVLGGATLYELVGKNEYNKLVFEEVDENRLEAGKPYIFVPENGNTEIKVYNTSDEAVNGPVAHNGMMGTFTNLSTLPAPDGQGDSSPLWNKYIISNNHYVYVDYTNCRLGAYRAYITSLDDVAPANPEPGQNQNGAPRRRIVMGAQSEQVATGCENLNVSDKPVKMIINGQLFIIRGEKMYDAKGQLVK